MKKLIIISCLLLVPTIIINPQQNDFPKLTGPYLGQKPPDTTPELFAPGVVSTGMNESSLVYTPDFSEIYFDVTHITHQYTAIVCMKRQDGIWRHHEVAHFSGKFMDSSPFIDGDNQKLFFCSNRPYKKNHDKQDFDLWYVERNNKGWSEPINLGSHINSDKVDVNPCVTKSGTLYFASNREGGMGGHDIYKSLLIDGKYQTPENLRAPINTSYFESSPYISPDESYIIFNVFVGSDSDRKSGLHVSYKTDDGLWSKPIYMGDTINMGGPSMFAHVSPDGKYLFFTSQNVPYLPYAGEALNYEQLKAMLNGPQNGSGDIYWVDAKIIDELRPRE